MQTLHGLNLARDKDYMFKMLLLVHEGYGPGRRRGCAAGAAADDDGGAGRAQHKPTI